MLGRPPAARVFVGLGVLVATVLGFIVWLRFAAASPESIFNAAMVDLDRGDLTLIQRSIRELEQAPGFEDHVRLLNGRYLLRRGLAEFALSRLVPIPHTGQLRPKFLLFAAQAYHLQNRLRDAERLLLALLKERPDDAECLRWLGLVYYDLGAYDVAMGPLKQLSRLLPDDYRADRLIGLMHHDFEMDSEAMLHYRRALERHPPPEVRQEIITEFAEACVALRRYAEAQELLQDSEPTVPNLVLQAQCSWSLGDIKTARAKLMAARRIDEKYRNLLLLEAEIRSTEQNQVGALEILRQCLGFHPHDPETRYRLALTLQSLGRETEAEAEFAAWRESKDAVAELQRLNIEAMARPHDVEVRLNLAAICDKIGRPALADMWRRAAAGCRNLAAPLAIPQN